MIPDLVSSALIRRHPPRFSLPIRRMRSQTPSGSSYQTIWWMCLCDRVNVPRTVHRAGCYLRACWRSCATLAATTGLSQKLVGASIAQLMFTRCC